MRDQLIQSGDDIGFYIILPFSVNPLGQNSFITKKKRALPSDQPQPTELCWGRIGRVLQGTWPCTGLLCSWLRGRTLHEGVPAGRVMSSGDSGNLFPSKTMTKKWLFSLASSMHQKKLSKEPTESPGNEENGYKYLQEHLLSQNRNL